MFGEELFDAFEEGSSAPAAGKAQRKRRAQASAAVADEPVAKRAASRRQAKDDQQAEAARGQEARAAGNPAPGASAAPASPVAAAALAAPVEMAAAAAATAATAAAPSVVPARRRHADDTFGKFAEQRVVVRKTLERDRCLVERCFPPHWDDERMRADLENATTAPLAKPAKEYPFVLDPFQREAVASLESSHSVLVSAHTSAGKTVVAEYAIAMALRDKQRVVYTSPIKALSNQKYRELHREFEDVGLMTGDVTLNPSASCLVMTTEILRNMLYRGSEVMREVAWVIFDEIHYMRDKDRGVVWEETLILLPDRVRYVFLSATIPNAAEFAMWIAKLHQQPCDVVYTDYRPTPLQHYVFPAGGDGLYLVVDEKGNFRDDNFQRALAHLTSEAPAEGDGDGKQKKRGSASKKRAGGDIYGVVKTIMERQYYPVIVFSFSKRECESHALKMAQLEFTDNDEKKLIGQIFSNAMESLSEDDRRLPQVESILPLLKRGIGIHHGGLLPILKEVIELLFQEGFLKCLFSTETFSMGLNMPAKTVVFTNVRKFDGESFRLISSGEYIQMSGRAGRRGLDDRGIVVMMLDEQIDPADAKEMIKGQADPLNSAFHLGYNMLLNLLRVEEADPEYMMQRSFFQFQSNRAAPRMQEQLELVQREIESVSLSNPVLVAEYCQLRAQLERQRRRMRAEVNQPVYLLPFLNAGRLVRVKRSEEEDWGWGVVVSFTRRYTGGLQPLGKTRSAASGDPGKETDSAALGVVSSSSSSSSAAAPASSPSASTAARAQPAPSEGTSEQGYIVEVLLECAAPRPNAKAPRLPSAGESTEFLPVPVTLSCLESLSSIRLFVPQDLKHRSSRAATLKNLHEVLRRFPDGPPLLDPIEDLQIKGDEFLKALRAAESIEDRLLKHPVHKSPTRQADVAAFARRAQLEEKATALRTEIKNAQQDVVMLQTLKSMKRVLRRLDYSTADDVILLKGRVACEISTADELLVTELMFGGVFNDLSVEQTVALLSCLVYEERSDDPVKLPEELAAPYRQLVDVAKRVAQVMQDARVVVDMKEYLEKLRPNMMEVMYAWCRGAKFAQVCQMTNAFEGSIIRCIRRLEELLRQLASAAKAIGNADLEAKFNKGIEKIKRDIVFAASLYL